jgi:hypothetical protein
MNSHPSEVNIVGTGATPASPHNINTFLDGLEKELAIYQGEIERLGSTADKILLPDHSPSEKSLDEDIPLTSPVGGRILALTASMRRMNRELRSITQRLDL